MKKLFTFSIIGILFCMVSYSSVVKADHKGPTMGWSSWNTYSINITDQLVRKQADALVGKGLLDKGYNYLNIDDGFFGGRDAKGGLYTHKTRFPNGMWKLVDYIHSKGLKAGIYSDAGMNTCGSIWSGDSNGRGVGMYGHYEQDADTFFNAWKFDFIKLDYCGGQEQGLDEEHTFRKILSAINATGQKDIKLNICRWAFPGTWASEVGTSWRTTADINASWPSVKNIIQKNLYLSAYATRGHYNDMDMLEVGRGLNAEEDKTHFGLWCIMSSPLLIGCDISTISDNALKLISNQELIALNQDTLGLQAEVVKKEKEVYLLAKDIEKRNSTSKAIAVYNSSDAAATMTIDFEKDLYLMGKVKFRDLFKQEDKGSFDKNYSVTVPAHGTRIYRVEGEKRIETVRYEAETGWLKKYQDLRKAETARHSEMKGASGDVMVHYIGNAADNYLEWKHIYSKNGGTYKLTIKYMSGENRTLLLSINGKERSLTQLHSGGWTSIGSTTVDVELEKGENVIRIGNPSAWAPDIDCIELKKKENAL